MTRAAQNMQTGVVQHHRVVSGLPQARLPLPPARILAPGVPHDDDSGVSGQGHGERPRRHHGYPSNSGAVPTPSEGRLIRCVKWIEIPEVRICSMCKSQNEEGMLVEEPRGPLLCGLLSVLQPRDQRYTLMGTWCTTDALVCVFSPLAIRSKSMCAGVSFYPSTCTCLVSYLSSDVNFFKMSAHMCPKRTEEDQR